MESSFESLPFELLEEICHRIIPLPSQTIHQDMLVSSRCRHFPYSDLSRLGRTCKRLHSHVEPLLYGTNTARTIALYRAIREGNVDTIRKAIAYGASPDIIEVHGSVLDEIMYGEKNCWNVPALYLALKFRQPAAFQTLLEHGADIYHPALWRLPPKSNDDDAIIKNEPKGYDEPYDICLGNKIVKHLCKPCNERSLRLVLDRAASDSPSDRENGEEPRHKALPIQRIPLVSVMSWASLDLLQLLLDNKVDPNGLRPGLGYQFMSPLSAAVLLHSPEKFDLLISKGADVNGRSLAKKQALLHIPVFAAVTQMRHGPSGLAMLKLCLDHGVDINRPCHENLLGFDFPRRHMCKGDEIPHVCTSALFTFLTSVRSWSEALAKPGEISPLLGLKYLLDAGASAMSPPSMPIRRKHINTQQLLHDRNYAGASSAVELLLDKQSLRSVSTQPSLFQALEMLISHGAAQQFHARILVKYDSIKESSCGWVCPEDVNTWRRLLDLLIDDMKKRDVNMDAVLRRVIADKGNLRQTISHSPWRGVGEIGRASIDALLAAGANINARIDVPLKEATASNCDTALQEVCTAIIHTDWLYEDIHDHVEGQLCEYSLMNATTFRDWLAFLISRGADPWLRNTHKHKENGSAINVILSPIKDGRVRIDGRGSLERHLMGLFNVLRGWSVPSVYKGERSERDWIKEFGWLSTSLQRGRNASGAQCLPR